ncbi:hypothetical protein NM578_003071 [Enterobacter hormaechei]|nr:hypothetical protein [Enterobacter hormaechei]
MTAFPASLWGASTKAFLPHQRVTTEGMYMVFEAITPLNRTQRFSLALARVKDFIISETVGFNALKGNISFEDRLALKYANSLSRYSGNLNARFGQNIYGKAILLYKNNF